MSDSKQSRKINRFFAEFIAKLRKWLNKIGSPVRISRRFVRQLLSATRGRGKGRQVCITNRDTCYPCGDFARGHYRI